MKDNFDEYKWFKNQYLNENDNTINNIELLADPRDLKYLKDLLRIIITDLNAQDVDIEDIKLYLSQFIDQI